ncbi:glycerophosphodiester phosphodiesterase family protein [Actinopolymorpha alba]|uniref:glycerophosphodiester phosphodiesterase family protein n=1 Tax=Actinopolymorpha alba TaxID=533267 RepID=UPI00037903E6|nr:glycerophosphodiester phosphodiesterase family protein [Actinopolymorpha alba]
MSGEPAGSTSPSPNGRREVIIVAHRGASGMAPENTLAAIREAARQRAHFVELDVVLSSDGVPVLIHDTSLARTTNAVQLFPDRAPWHVGDFTLEELRKLDAGSWFDERYAGERIPTFAEALDTLREEGLGLWLELKSPERHPDLEQAVADVLRSAPGDWLTSPDRARRVKVTSFNHEALAKFAAEIDHAVPLGGLSETVPDDATLRHLAGWLEYFIPDHRRLRPGDVVRMRAAGLKTAFWIPNGPVAVASLVALGADALIQNYPAVARQVIERGEPVPGPASVVIERVAGSGETEHVVLRNVSSGPVDVGGWYVRDDPGDRLWIPPSYVIPAGGTLEVYSGAGTDMPDRCYNGLSVATLGDGGDSVALHRADGEVADVAGNDLTA